VQQSLAIRCSSEPLFFPPVLAHALQISVPASANFLFRLTNLPLYFALRLLESLVGNTFHFSAFQEKNTDNSGYDDSTNIEPEIVFFLFHLSYLNKTLWFVTQRSLTSKERP
jgi:hypothetical protein